MTTTTGIDTRRLRRIQTGARATLALGIGASLTANILAADPSLIGRLVAGWSPLALMLTVELLSRVPTTGGRLSRLRVLAAGAIAAIAAWVSYWHMVEVSLAAGESTVAAHLLPLSVDGLVIVASICLVEITNRLDPTDPSRPNPPRVPHRTPPPRPELPAAAPARPTVKPTPALDGKARATAGGHVRRLAAEHPEWSQAELAAAAGCSVRTVRRHLNSPATAAPAPTPGPVTAPAAELGPVEPELESVSDDRLDTPVPVFASTSESSA